MADLNDLLDQILSSKNSSSQDEDPTQNLPQQDSDKLTSTVNPDILTRLVASGQAAPYSQDTSSIQSDPIISNLLASGQINKETALRQANQVPEYGTFDEPSLFDRVSDQLADQQAKGNVGVSDDDEDEDSDEESARNPASSAENPNDSEDDEDDTSAPTKPDPMADALAAIKQAYGPDALNKALQAQKDAKNSALWQLGNAQIAAGFTRGAMKPNEAAADLLQAHSGDALRALDLQRQGAMGLIEGGMKLSDLNDKTLARDPNSSVSQAYRTIALQAQPQLGNDPNFKNLDAEGVKQLLPGIDTIARMKMMQAQQAYMRQIRQQQIWDRGMQDSTDKIASLSNRGAMKNAADINRQVDNVMSLVNGTGGDFNKLDNVQLNLLRSEVAKMATGGVATEHGLEHVMPPTLEAKAAQLWSQTSGNPTPAQMGAFVQEMTPYLQELQQNSKAYIGSQIIPPIEGANVSPAQRDSLRNLYGDYLSAAQAQKVKKAAMSGGSLPGGNPPLAGGNPAHPQDAEAITWAKQNLGSNNPQQKAMAVQILKANGVM